MLKKMASRSSRLQRRSQVSDHTEVCESRVLLSSLTVNSLEDNLTSGDGLVTLREAILAANTDATTDLGQTGSGADTIVFDASLVAGGDITVLLSLFDTGLDNNEVGPTAFSISSEISIIGSTSANGVTIQRSGAASNFRLFHVTADGNLTLENLTLSGGVARGGNGDDASGGGAGLGGALFNQGQLTIVSSTVSGNTAVGGNGSGGHAWGGAGGMGGNGTENSGGGPNGGASGGRISAGANGGFGGGAGGSYYQSGGNGGFGGGGGGSYYGAGGHGGFGGGGGGSTRGGNGTGGFGAGPGTRSFATGFGGGGAGMGGAIFNFGGQITITNSTVSGNTASGGLGGMFGYEAPGSGLGGGLFNRNGTVLITNSTLSENTGGALYNLGDGAAATLEMNNSILANSTVGSDAVGNTINGGTSTVTGGFNLIETSSGDGIAATVVSTSDPGLGSLQDNGGPTFTHAITASSAAFDAGNNVLAIDASSSALTTDQRGSGFSRVQNGTVDIGAFEVPNQAPSVALQNTTTTLAENADTTTRIKVADIVVTDDGLGTNALSLTGDDAALFEIDSNVLYLIAGAMLDFEINATLDVTVNVDDSEVGSTPDDTDALSITITDVNEAPTVALQNATNTLAENADTSARIKVADIVVTDDALGSNTLSLTGADAALFEIDGTELYLIAGAALDFETNPALDVTVNVDDAEVGNTPDDTDMLSITITDVNEAPTVSLQNTTTTLAENADTTTRTKVADIVVTDDGLGTNTLTLSGSDAAMFEIDGTELYLIAGAALDFETNPTLDVTVDVDDTSVGGTPDDLAPLSISVTDINEAPSVSLTPLVTRRSENAVTNTRFAVAQIVVTDDALGSATLSLAGSDAALFEIDGTTLYLRAGVTLDFETNPSLDVIVQVDDSTVGTTPDDSASFAIAINNVNEAPTITLTNTTATIGEGVDTSQRILVETFTIRDDALGSYIVSLGGRDAGMFELAGVGLFLRAGVTLNAAANPVLDVIIKVDDPTISTGVDASAIEEIQVLPVQRELPVTPSSVVGFSEGDFWLSRPTNSTGTSYQTGIAAQTMFAAADIARSVQGDFNGDGLDDVGVWLTNGEWHIGLNDGHSQFEFSHWTTWRTDGVKGINVGDFNGDGLDDLSAVFQADQQARIWIYESTKSTFLPDLYTSYTGFDGILNVVAGEFDGKNGDDLAIHNSAGAWWVAASDVAGTTSDLKLWFRRPGDAQRTISNYNVADFNNDGRDDIQFISDIAGSDKNFNVSVGLSRGSSFSVSEWHQMTVTQSLNAFVVGDFNGDNQTDIAALLNNRRWWVGLSNGTSAFSWSSWGVWNPSISLQNVSVGDTNGDGRADVLGRGTDNQWLSLESLNTTFRSRNLFSWSSPTSWSNVLVGRFATGDTPAPPSAADFEAFGSSSLLDLLHGT